MTKRFSRLLPLLLLAVSFTAHAAPAVRKMLVISPRGFQEALKDFVTYKQTLQPVEWLALEDILTKAAGADDPEKLKRFLYDEWRQHQIGYALLAGDVDVFPVRYMVLDRKTPAAFDYAFYPSDLYYADLAKPDGSFEDWNAQKDSFHAGYFGEVRGEAIKSDPINYDQVDYIPEIAVGRWPVSTPEEVRIVAGKSAAYEKAVLAGTDPKLHRAGFFSVGGWVDSRSLLGDLAKKLETGWKIERRFYSSPTPPPDHDQIRAVLNEGAGLLVHAGHGQPDAWEQCFSTADLAALTNSTSVPVIISAGCSTAHFAPLPPYEKYVDRDGKSHRGTDRGEQFTEPPLPPSPYQTGKVNPGCLGEQVLKRAGTGGVAYIGCNTGSQPFGLTLVDGFISELARAKAPRLGDCWSSAIHYYVDHEKLRELKPTESWTPPSVFFQGMKFMLFGDPSLRLPENTVTVPPPPPAVELRSAIEKCAGPTRNQGARGTCSVFTLTGALEFALGRNEPGGSRLSVEYLNWASNQTVGRAVDGGFFSDLWRGYLGYGICSEGEMPYTAAFDPAKKPESATVEAAKKRISQGLRIHWIKEWNVRTGLEPAQLTAIKQTLASGWPVCGGFRWPKQEQWDNDVLRMCPPDAVFDGHSILITGYRDDSTQPGGGTLLFRNTNRPASSGSMPYDYARAYMNDAAWIDSPPAG